MLFAVTKFKRVMALLGVTYLVTVGGLYFVLADRSDNFIHDGQIIQGTVTAVYSHRSVSTVLPNTSCMPRAAMLRSFRTPTTG